MDALRNRHTPGAWASALAGGLAAAVGLAATELAAAWNRRVPSLIVAVGDLVIEYAPESMTRPAIRRLGSDSKPALLVGIVVVAVVAGAALGAASRRRRWVPAAGFAVLGLLGAIAGAREPFASPVLVFAAAFVAAEVAAAAFLLLRAALIAPTAKAAAAPTGSDAPLLERRRFVGLVSAVVAVAGVSVLLSRVLRERLSVAAARAAVRLPAPTSAATRPVPAARLRVPGLTPLVTPNDRFYRVDTSLLVPQVEPDDWRLRITGMVKREYELTYDELLALPLVEVPVTLACVSNEVGGSLIGTARWLGVPLRGLLEQAGPRDGASQLVGRSVDGFTAGFPTQAAFDGRPALVAVGMNGEPLPLAHGFPARLVVAGLYGYASATKWLTEIELTTLDGFDAYWARRGWAKHAPIETQSRVDVPRDGSTLDAGRVTVAGVAWAPTRGIRQVEVQVNSGPWAPAALAEPFSDDTWRQWSSHWEAQPGAHTLRVRATDGTGATQTARDRSPIPAGATGYHSIRVTVRDS